jgi:hypothetical protein
MCVSRGTIAMSWQPASRRSQVSLDKKWDNGIARPLTGRENYFGGAIAYEKNLVSWRFAGWTEAIS